MLLLIDRAAAHQSSMPYDIQHVGNRLSSGLQQQGSRLVQTGISTMSCFMLLVTGR